MSSSTPRAAGQQSNRRSHARQRIDQLSYAAFGPGNGGILLNLSEDGASFQGIGTVRTGQFINLSFKLPGNDSQIEAYCDVVWVNESGKGGGLRFIELNEQARQHIKKWLGTDNSLSANTPKEVTSPTEPASALTTSYKDLIQPLPEPTVTESPVPISPDAPASNIRPNFQLAPDEPSSSNPRATRKGMPSFILAEYPKSQRQRSTSPKFVLFATGMLAGCIGVLAAIVGMRIFASPNRPRISESAQSPAAAAQPTADEPNQNSPVDAAALNDKQVTFSDPNVDANAAASERSLIKSEPQEVAAIEPAARPELDVKPPPDSSHERKPSDQRNLALLKPRTPAYRPKAELREPSVGEGMQPAFISTDGPRLAAPSVPDAPKPPQQLVEKSGPAAGFTDAVLLQHDPPIYPASAMKKHLEGLVTVNATIGTDGVPRELKIVSGDPVLAQAAEEAISHWRYVPAVFGGVPVESQVAITINFQSIK